MEKESFLKINDLRVQYTFDGQIVKAVNGVSLELDRGETLGLVGETGAGKTTIAKAIMRILQTPPAKILSGEIVVDGEDLLQKSEKEMLSIRGDRISMIFQDPMTALNPVMTIGEQINEAVMLHNGFNHAQSEARTVEMLEMVGIPAERYSEYPHQFSGGMKQRVVIAMALACNPELLLADEPTTALDVTIQAQVLDMINELKDKFGTAMILITHDLGIIARTCEKVAIIYAGQIVEQGSKEDVFRHPSHPYTQGLFDSLPKMDSDTKKLNPIPGLPPDPTNLPGGCVFAPRCRYADEGCTANAPEFTELTRGHFCRCHKPLSQRKENNNASID